MELTPSRNRRGHPPPHERMTRRCLGGGERLPCDRERGIGACLGQFELAQRRREPHA